MVLSHQVSDSEDDDSELRAAGLAEMQKLDLMVAGETGGTNRAKRKRREAARGESVAGEDSNSVATSWLYCVL